MCKRSCRRKTRHCCCNCRSTLGPLQRLQPIELRALEHLLLRPAAEVEEAVELTHPMASEAEIFCYQWYYCTPWDALHACAGATEVLLMPAAPQCRFAPCGYSRVSAFGREMRLLYWV